MPRTITTNQHVFARPGNVTYTLPSPPYSSSIVTITIPRGSNWTSGLHWHETHTEFLRILQGQALVTLGTMTRVCDSTDGIITVPRFARHEWRRTAETENDIDLIVEEWTDPADGQKEQFFRNLSSVIQDNTKAGPPIESWLTLQLFVVFAGLDNYPILFSVPKLRSFGNDHIEWACTHLVLGFAVLIGRLLGLHSTPEEYTPPRLSMRKED